MVKQLFFFIVLVMARCTNDSLVTAKPLGNDAIKDSLSACCMGDKGFREKLDTLVLEQHVLTLRLGKYINCAYQQIDSFYFRNDTLNIDLTAVNKEKLACECYFKIYAGLNWQQKIPKTITINGDLIRNGYCEMDAEEK